jgi:hypothetical protein
MGKIMVGMSKVMLAVMLEEVMEAQMRNKALEELAGLGCSRQ